MKRLVPEGPPQTVTSTEAFSALGEGKGVKRGKSGHH